MSFLKVLSPFSSNTPDVASDFVLTPFGSCELEQHEVGYPIAFSRRMNKILKYESQKIIARGGNPITAQQVLLNYGTSQAPNPYAPASFSNLQNTVGSVSSFVPLPGNKASAPTMRNLGSKLKRPQNRTIFYQIDSGRMRFFEVDRRRYDVMTYMDGQSIPEHCLNFLQGLSLQRLKAVRYPDPSSNGFTLVFSGPPSMKNGKPKGAGSLQLSRTRGAKDKVPPSPFPKNGRLETNPILDSGKNNKKGFLAKSRKSPGNMSKLMVRNKKSQSDKSHLPDPSKTRRGQRPNLFGNSAPEGKFTRAGSTLNNSGFDLGSVVSSTPMARFPLPGMAMPGSMWSNGGSLPPALFESNRSYTGEDSGMLLTPSPSRLYQPKVNGASDPEQSMVLRDDLGNEIEAEDITVDMTFEDTEMCHEHLGYILIEVENVAMLLENMVDKLEHQTNEINSGDITKFTPEQRSTIARRIPLLLETLEVFMRKSIDLYTVALGFKAGKVLDCRRRLGKFLQVNGEEEEGKLWFEISEIYKVKMDLGEITNQKIKSKEEHIQTLAFFLERFGRGQVAKRAQLAAERYLQEMDYDILGLSSRLMAEYMRVPMGFEVYFLQQPKSGLEFVREQAAKQKTNLPLAVVKAQAQGQQANMTSSPPGTLFNVSNEDTLVDQVLRPTGSKKKRVVVQKEQKRNDGSPSRHEFDTLKPAPPFGRPPPSFRKNGSLDDPPPAYEDDDLETVEF